MNAITALTSPAPVKLTVDDFRLLQESGAFAAYNKTELIDGVVVTVNAQWSAHAYVKTQIAYRLTAALIEMGSELRVISEVSLAIPPFGEPQPDIVVTSAVPSRDPLKAETTSLVIEIADTTARFDLGEKSQIYASGEIPEYWVVDLTTAEIKLFWRAEGGRWQDDNTVRLGDTIASATIAGLTIGTDGLDFL